MVLDIAGQEQAVIIMQQICAQQILMDGIIQMQQQAAQ